MSKYVNIGHKASGAPARKAIYPGYGGSFTKKSTKL